MPRIPSEDEEDAIAMQDDDRSETANDVQSGKPAAAARAPVSRVVQYDDSAARQPAGTMAHSITYEPRPVRSMDDLDPAVAQHLKAAAAATKKRLAELEEEDREAAASTEKSAAPPVAVAVAAPAQPAAPVVPPGAAAPVAAAAPAPAIPDPAATPVAEPVLDPRVVKAFEALTRDKTAFETEREEWQKTIGAQQKKLNEIVEMFDFDPVGAIAQLAKLRLNTEDQGKIDAYLDEVSDDLTGHRLKIEADESKKAKRESRRTRAEWERYKQEQRANAEKAEREATAQRTRAEADREAQTIATWFSGTPDTSHVWLRTHDDPAGVIRDVKKEFQKHGQSITDDQAAAFADKQLKEYAQAHFTRFKHLLAPEPNTAAATAAPAAQPAAVTAQGTQPATPPPANSQRTRDLTNTAVVTTPTTPPPPPKPFDPNEDAEESRRRSLSRWAAKRKASQQQQP